MANELYLKTSPRSWSSRIHLGAVLLRTPQARRGRETASAAAHVAMPMLPDRPGTLHPSPAPNRPKRDRGVSLWSDMDGSPRTPFRRK